MPKRELFAAVALPVVLGAIVWLPPWGFLTILAVAVGLAGDELLGMARTADVPCGRLLPILALLLALAGGWRYGATGIVAALAVAAVVLPAAQLARRDAPARSLSGAAVALLAVTYLGVTGACLGWLFLWPADQQGARLLLFFLASIWIGDSAAYYVGSRLGRHKMAPRVSPNKTLEGLAGGVAATYLAAFAAKAVLGLTIGWAHCAALATILAVAAPLGDLVESQLKRDTGIKDSSSILPGHGGLLDRTDSLLYAAPPVLGYLLAAGLL